MTVAFLALAVAVLLAPGVAPALSRAAVLRNRGRLASVSAAALSVPGLSARPGAHRRSGRARRPAAVPVVLTAVVVGVTVRGGPALGVAAGLVAAAGWRLARGAARRRRDRAVRREQLTAVRLMVGELSAGGVPSAALEAAAGVCTGQRAALLVAAAAAVGTDGDPVEVLLGGDPVLRRLGIAWQVADAGGAPLAQVLSRCADDLAAEVEQEHAVATALAGPRSSALLLAGLPVLGLGLGALMGARPLAFLLRPGSGQLVLVAGVLLDVAGVLWTQRLLVRAEVIRPDGAGLDGARADVRGPAAGGSAP